MPASRSVVSSLSIFSEKRQLWLCVCCIHIILYIHSCARCTSSLARRAAQQWAMRMKSSAVVTTKRNEMNKMVNGVSCTMRTVYIFKDVRMLQYGWVERWSCGRVLMLVGLTLILPMSTACCEQGFSTMKHIKDDWRSSLSNDVLNDQLNRWSACWKICGRSGTGSLVISRWMLSSPKLLLHNTYIHVLLAVHDVHTYLFCKKNCNCLI